MPGAPTARAAIGMFDCDGCGVVSGGKRPTSAPLPDYPIARIRTGQHIPGQGELWRAEFRPGP